MKLRVSASTAFGAKIVVTLGLLFYLTRKVDIAPVFAQIRALAPAWAIGAAALVLLQLALSSLRWQLICRRLAAHLSLGAACRLTLIGHFFNQVLPTALGGDAVRVWLATREGVPLGPAVRGSVCDRVVGLVALTMMISGAFLMSPGLAADQPPLRNAFRLTAIVGFGGLLGLFVFGASTARWLVAHRGLEPVGRLLHDLHRVLYAPATSAATLALSLAAHLCAVGAIVMCARGMAIDLAFGAALTVLPAVMLVSMAPVSVAGWGVREGAMVVGLGVLGIGAADALAISVAYGLVQVGVGLAGGAVWFARRGDRTAPRRAG